VIGAAIMVAKIATGEVEDNATPADRRITSIRMQTRCFTRLTNAFSKKFANHVHALALYFMFYNFVRIHKTLKVTPAMAAGVSATLWTMEDIAERIEARRPSPSRRGPCKKRASA
jgi:hypothetical protein